MADRISQGSLVQWNWGQGTGEGKVVERFERRVGRTINGARVTRNATPDNPAYLIEQDDGGRVLKSASELGRVSHASV